MRARARVYISATAAARAWSTRWYLVMTSSGKKLPGRSLGTLRDSSHAGLERARPVAVPAVAGGLAHLVGLGVHDAVGDVLGEPADELLQVDDPVLDLTCRDFRF